MKTLAINALILMMAFVFPGAAGTSSNTNYEAEELMVLEDWMFEQLIPDSDEPLKLEDWMFEPLN